MYFAILTLQNALFLKIIAKKFAYIKKKQYLCIGFIKYSNLIMIYLIVIIENSQTTTKY